MCSYQVARYFLSRLLLPFLETCQSPPSFVKRSHTNDINRASLITPLIAAAMATFSHLLAPFYAVLVLLLAGSLTVVSAARQCGSGSNSSSATYSWAVTDWRYYGPDPTHPKDTYGTVGGYLTPGTTRTLYSCFSQWPEPWGGRFGGYNGSLIWNDCRWTGPGETAEETVSFAMDLVSQTVYMSHTFKCSDISRQGFVSLPFLSSHFS